MKVEGWITLPPDLVEEFNFSMMCQSRWLSAVRDLLWKIGWYKDWDMLPTEEATAVAWIAPRDITNTSIGYEDRGE
jgi:hypothetical protein